MQIIVFTLGEQYYAMKSENVEEITTMQESTVVPKAPHYIEGLINLRGNVISLVNLSKLLRQEENECYNNIVIIDRENEKLGLLVSDVKEVLKIDEEEIEKVTNDSKNGVIGVIRMEKTLVNYIDLERIIS